MSPTITTLPYTLIVPFSGSRCSLAALRAACEEAKIVFGTVLAQYVQTTPATADDINLHFAEIRAESILDKARAIAEEYGVPFEGEIAVSDDVAAAVCDLAAERISCEVWIARSPRRGLFRDWRDPSPIRTAIKRHAPCPVGLVTAPAHEGAQRELPGVSPRVEQEIGALLQPLAHHG